MRIIIISGAAPPEPITAGRVHYDLACHLAGENNQVWLITPKPSRPLGARYQKSKGNGINKLNDNLIHVRINSFTCPKYNLLSRALESADFGIRSIKYINSKIKDYDLIYASPWAFLGQLFILLFRKNSNAAVIMNVQDLYPESFFLKIKSKIVSRLLYPFYYVDRYIARKSTHLTVICEGLKKIYTDTRQISGNKISVIPNWQDSDPFSETVDLKANIIERYSLRGATGKFIFMYLGNIGPVAGVETILESFSKLDDDGSFLIIAGSGSAKEKCQRLARRLGTENLSFIEVPKGLKPVVELQSIADVLLLPINPQAAISSIPSKLIAYMFSGKPVITSANGSSESASAIRKSGCGWITDTNDIPDWIDKMRQAHKTEKQILIEMGRSGYNYAIENYSRKEGLKKISQLIYKFNRA
jgi:glycosyltransferase involved in cell wall biosynthesis